MYQTWLILLLWPPIAPHRDSLLVLTGQWRLSQRKKGHSPNLLGINRIIPFFRILPTLSFIHSFRQDDCLCVPHLQDGQQTACRELQSPLTCICSKVLEHVICKHILHNLKTHNILIHQQRGFRSGYSCGFQLITTLLHFTQSYGLNIHADIAILHFVKAFETVWQNHLLGKFHHSGIHANIHFWIQYLLKGCIQQVAVDGVQSQSNVVESGVPQETALDPLVFLLYIDDNSDCVSPQITLFTDYSYLCKTIRTEGIRYHYSKTCGNLEQWCTKCVTHPNSNSWKSKQFAAETNEAHTHELHHWWNCETSCWPSRDQDQVPGMTITNNLSRSTRTASIAGNVNSKIGFLWINLPHCTERKTMKTYFAQAHSFVE